MDLAEYVRSQALAKLGHGTVSHDQLNDVLRLFAKYRSQLIQNTLLKVHGARVLAGPFAGMEFVNNSSEGCHVAKLLGCYEGELHQFVETIVVTGYDVVVNIGCSEGYYAIGLARRCPSVRVFAHDINPLAQQACQELAARNGVAERVTVAGLFDPTTFRAYQGRRALFIIDIEGNELDLLESVPAAELSRFDFIIECHDCFRPQASERLSRHFAESHAQRLVNHEIRSVDLPPMFSKFGHLDQLLALWEWRMGPTPWLIMASHQWPESPFCRAVLEAQS